MDNTQHNHLDMFLTVSKHASKNQAITDTIPAFAEGIIALNVQITAIQTTSGEQDLAISGVTTNKNQLKEALAQSTFSVISPTKAYATKNNNSELKEQMNLSLTEIREKLDDQLAPTAQALLNIINPLAPQLANYAITPAIINSWQQDIENYKDVLANPRIAITHRASLTQDLVTLFSEANATLKETLDPISIAFKKDNPHYYNDYRKAREIIDLGTTTTRIKGRATMLSSTGEPAYNKKIKINEQEIETSTDVNGLFLLEPQAPSTLTITASGDNIQPQTTAPLEIKKGETIIKNFVLQPPTNP